MVVPDARFSQSHICRRVCSWEVKWATWEKKSDSSCLAKLSSSRLTWHNRLLPAIWKCLYSRWRTMRGFLTWPLSTRFDVKFHDVFAICSDEVALTVRLTVTTLSGFGNGRNPFGSELHYSRQQSGRCLFVPIGVPFWFSFPLQTDFRWTQSVLSVCKL